MKLIDYNKLPAELQAMYATAYANEVGGALSNPASRELDISTLISLAHERGMTGANLVVGCFLTKGDNIKFDEAVEPYLGEFDE